jgi:hypothetical protein
MTDLIGFVIFGVVAACSYIMWSMTKYTEEKVDYEYDRSRRKWRGNKHSLTLLINVSRLIGKKVDRETLVQLQTAQILSDHVRRTYGGKPRHK